MFPTGMAAAALFVLRVSVAATLVVDGPAHWAEAMSFWAFPGCLFLAVCLCLGFLTPYCAVLACIIELGVLFATGGHNAFEGIISVVHSGVVAVLGPGSFSLDGRIFGRRILTVPLRK